MDWSREGYPEYVRVSIEISEAELAWVDHAVENGLFPSREAAVRGAMDGSLEALDDVAIAEAYRRAYARQPAAEGHAKAGLAFLSDALQAERRGA